LDSAETRTSPVGFKTAVINLHSTPHPGVRTSASADTVSATLDGAAADFVEGDVATAEVVVGLVLAVTNAMQ
jgi:hypothetical protein